MAERDQERYSAGRLRRRNSADDFVIDDYPLSRDLVPGKENKFVIIEDEAWFLPFENNDKAPRLIDILRAVTYEDFDDDQVVQAMEAQMENGVIIMGYVSKETGDVSIHLPDVIDSEIVRRRLDADFGEGTIYG